MVRSLLRSLWTLAALLVLAAPGAALAEGQDGGEVTRRIRFDEVVQCAIQRSYSAQLAALEIERADALVEQARSASLPSLGATATFTRLDHDRTLGDRVIAGASQLSVDGSLAVPLVVPQRWAQWSHAGDNAAAVRASGDEVRRQVALAAARAFLAVIAQHRVVEATERAHDAARAHLDYARARLDGGVGSRLDEVRAAQELAADATQLQSTYTGLARTREALGILVGGDEPLDAADGAPLPPPPSLPGALAEAATRRADVKAGQARAAAADRVVRDRWTDYAPYLNLVAQPFFQRPPSLVNPELGWQAQLILTLPLYDGGLRYGQERERAALDVEARVALEQTRRQARSEVRVAFEALRRADDALASARESARLARQALDLADLAFRAGATTNLEVIDAERSARDADTNVAVAEDAARQARLDLLAASGRFP